VHGKIDRQHSVIYDGEHEPAHMVAFPGGWVVHFGSFSLFAADQPAILINPNAYADRHRNGDSYRNANTYTYTHTNSLTI
jgi:hypothetical protein